MTTSLFAMTHHGPRGHLPRIGHSSRRWSVSPAAGSGVKRFPARYPPRTTRSDSHGCSMPGIMVLKRRDAWFPLTPTQRCSRWARTQRSRPRSIGGARGHIAGTLWREELASDDTGARSRIGHAWAARLPDSSRRCTPTLTEREQQVLMNELRTVKRAGIGKSSSVRRHRQTHARSAVPQARRG